ncbi:MAE_28990/MAE_18760 family HEPN-like nuclease [Clostridium sp. UBA1652]|uniref:MAE_28990/MAE_18760 family HEPN-like nuclease n=1 Tax=Clostridium sp. UBA1652 TaxID=1946348 RepID=UPI00257BA851|nr:MAE_28990/MAE_18760 family HEPN-like nuclease [Clostridium sp. UBA1652]
MSTLSGDFFQDFDARWNEVDILINMADELSDDDPKFQVICRATIVLMVANLEGFLSESLKCLIGDINSNQYFKYTSEKMKETYCMQFFDSNEKGNEKKIRKLITIFDELDTKYTIEPFLYENNKNPKASVVEKIFGEVGGRNFFGFITDCDIEKVFENDIQFNITLISKMKQVLINGTVEFPYLIDIDNIGFNLENSRVDKDCLWQVFINQTLKSRNSVAHGISRDNNMLLSEIKETKEKIVILQLSFAILLFMKAIKSL